MRLHEECGDAPADWSQSQRGTLIRRPSVAAGVGTYRSSKAKGFRDVGNGQSTVLTNLCAPHAHLGSGPEIPRAYSLSLDATYPTARAKSVIAIGGG